MTPSTSPGAGARRDHHMVSNEAAVYVDVYMASYQAPAHQRRRLMS